MDDLARTTSTHPETLYRLLRALASVGVFAERGDRRFELTPMGDYLRTDHPLSVRPIVMMLCGDYEWEAWGELSHSVRTGENAAVHALGVDVWEHRRRDAAAGEIFDAAMRTLSRSNAPGEVAAYDFGRHHVIADIGGGTGAVLAEILAAYPGPRGILFDQPEVVAGAAAVLAGSGSSTALRSSAAASSRRYQQRMHTCCGASCTTGRIRNVCRSSTRSARSSLTMGDSS